MDGLTIGRRLSPFDVVVWTCTAVFVITALAACASLVGLPTIRKGYETLVYSALIAQLFGVGIAAFARALGVKPPTESTTTSPSATSESVPPINPGTAIPELHPSETQASAPDVDIAVKARRPLARMLAVISLALVAVTTGYLGWAVSSTLPTLLASDLSFGGSCELTAAAIVKGNASIFIPDHCTAAKIAITEIAADARLSLINSPQSDDRSEPGASGQPGQAGTFAAGDGMNGSSGKVGAKGRPGRQPADIDVIVSRLKGFLYVGADGAPGVAGGPGGNGGNGGDGAQGTPSETSKTDSGHCDKWAGPGGKGGDGGTGGAGGPGGTGGSGTKVNIRVTDGISDKARIEVVNHGGLGGKPGEGSSGGLGGKGGPEGAISRGCPFPVPRAVVPGKPGAVGASGSSGEAGKDGAIVVILPGKTYRESGHFSLANEAF